MNYVLLTQNEQDDHIVEAMLGREREHFHRAVNIANYTAMLAALPAGTAWSTRIQTLLAEEQVAVKHEDEVYAALAAQLTDATRLANATARVLKRHTLREALQYQAPAATTVDETVLS